MERISMTVPAPVDLLDAAIAQARPVIAAVGPADLTAPTPCAEWDLRALLSHLAGRAILSERAAGGIAVTEMPGAAGDLLGSGAAASLPALLDASASAWREAGLGRQCVTPLGPMPAAALVTFQAQDVFVHGWDIARTLGVDTAFDTALTEAMLALHRQTISDELRAAFFAPIVPVPDDAPALDRLVGFLGRKP
jgi:uncharacterized protein (TIGR03086 family)